MWTPTSLYGGTEISDISVTLYYTENYTYRIMVDGLGLTGRETTALCEALPSWHWSIGFTSRITVVDPNPELLEDWKGIYFPPYQMRRYMSTLQNSDPHNTQSKAIKQKGYNFFVMCKIATCATRIRCTKNRAVTTLFRFALFPLHELSTDMNISVGYPLVRLNSKTT